MDVSEREKQWRTTSSFGLFRETSSPPPKNRSFRASFGVVALSFLLLTTVFVVLQVSRSSKSATKAKRYANYEPYRKHENVALIPETIHENHKYELERMDGNGNERIMKRNKIEETIQKKTEMKKKLERFMERGNPTIMGKPILFKGVYMRESKKKKDETEEDGREYFREINDMLEGKRKNESPEGTSKRKTYSHLASPFQIRGPGDDGNGGKAGDEIRKRKKPITVMLDIYPITKDDGNMKNSKDFPLRLPNFEPVPRAGRNLAYAILPKGGKPNKRMIMRLNLYPKDNPQRRTFGWRKKSRTCHLIDHNPNGKPITAEWKDENGDWIRANYLTLNYWDRKFT